ncbi:MAG: hypothetical protein ACLPKT_08995 [Methylocella sp.]
MKHQRDIRRFPTEKPPDPESKNPGAVGTATGVAEFQRVLEKTNQSCRKPNVNAFAALRQDGDDGETQNPHQTTAKTGATASASDIVTPLVGVGASAERGAAL